MIKRLLCSIFGHAPLRFHVLNNFPIIQVKDSLNEPLIAIDCCERCKSGMKVVIWSSFLVEGRSFEKGSFEIPLVKNTFIFP